MHVLTNMLIHKSIGESNKSRVGENAGCVSSTHTVGIPEESELRIGSRLGCCIIGTQFRENLKCNHSNM